MTETLPYDLVQPCPRKIWLVLGTQLGVASVSIIPLHRSLLCNRQYIYMSCSHSCNDTRQAYVTATTVATSLGNDTAHPGS